MLKKVIPITLAGMLIIFVLITSCKKESEISETDSLKIKEPISVDTIKQLDLVIKPALGQQFRYKMSEKRSIEQKSPNAKPNYLKAENILTYYYTHDVFQIEDDGTINYKMKFDSINIISSKTIGETTLSETYNSNVKDSVYEKLDYIQYNAIVGQDFKVRVTNKGDVKDIYAIEKIHNNLKNRVDNLNPEDKKIIKEAPSEEEFKLVIKAAVQKQFQKFPENIVKMDSLWESSYDDVYEVFPVKNNISYKILKLQNINGDLVVTLEGKLLIEFVKKEIKDKSARVKIEVNEAGGTSTIVFNLSKGTMNRKETLIILDAKTRLSAGSQSQELSEKENNTLTIELLQ